MPKSFVTGIFLTVWVLLGSQEKPAPSDAEGKAVTEKICATCHEMDTVTAGRRTEIGWRQNVEDMAGRGAEGSEQELAAVVQYLTKNFGKLNVNTATRQQLQEFLGLTEKEAQAVTAWRDRKGNFKDFDQLKAVPDVDGAKLQEKRSLIAFSL